MSATAERFVQRDVVRCPDCDIRGDLHATGYPLREAGHRIAICGECGGAAEIPASSKSDPYESVDKLDPWVRRRQERADAVALARAPRALRRRYLETVRVESLMSEEPDYAR